MSESMQHNAGSQSQEAIAPVEGRTAALQILGTQPPTWLPIAHVLHEALEASGATVATKPLQRSGSGPAAVSAARTIAFVDSPAHALAQWLAAGAPGTSTEILQSWHASARQLLQWVHRDPEACLVIDTAEAAAAPDALARAVTRWRSSSSTLKRFKVPSDVLPDALSVALAQRLCAEDAAGAELFDELHVASAVLVDKPEMAEPDRAAPDAPVRRYRELLASEVERQRLAGLVAAQRSEIEAIARRLREASERPDHAAEAANLRSALKHSRQESERLLLQLHRVQEALEHLYLRQKTLEDEGERFGWRGIHLFAQGTIRLLGEHERAPHRHLHFAVEHVRAGTRELPRLEVRLLDHLGRPGIVFFSARPSQALAAWQATGEESGRPFMALIPSDPLGQSLLERMGTADWQLVNHLVQRVQRYLAGEGSHLGVRWQTACARLCRQLADMPARLRYDRLQVGHAENDGAPELDVLLGRVSYGERLLDQVHLRWQAPGNGGTATRPPLRWLRPEDPTNVPLAGWPIGEDGLLASAFALPVGRGGDARQQRQQWAALSTVDRELVLAVLDALPGAAERTPDAALPGGVSRSVLTREAAAMHKDARRAMAALHLRDMARRIVRRIRGSK